MENTKVVPIKVCLVLKDRGWILEKMAMQLALHLPNWNVEGEITFAPSTAADVNHWMLYYDCQGGLVSRNTLAITHVDRLAKMHVLKQRLKKADLGICMSRMTLEQLVQFGVPRQKLCYITPAHDGNANPKRIVIGITSQIRLDGAKREYILIHMAQTIRLDAFHFEIIGPNWENVFPYFEAAGATVNYNPGAFHRDNAEHLRIVRERINCFDYYLYMGWDEGSMGFLDALAAGIPTIVTPQGFHLDINGGITHPFTDAAQLCAIFEKLSAERQRRIDSVSGLTWNKYARKHALVWHALVEGQREGMNALLHDEDKYDTPLPALSGGIWQHSGATVKIKGNSTSMMDDFLLLWEFYTKTQFHTTWMYRLARSIKRLLLRSGKQ